MTNNYGAVGFRSVRIVGDAPEPRCTSIPTSPRAPGEIGDLGSIRPRGITRAEGSRWASRAGETIRPVRAERPQVNCSTGWEVDGAANELDFLLRWKNPTFLRAPHMSQTLDLYSIEGRYGAAASVGWNRDGRSAGIGLTWLQAGRHPLSRSRILRGSRHRGTQRTGGVTKESDSWRLGLRATIAGGLAYDEAARDPVYGRLTVDGHGAHFAHRAPQLRVASLLRRGRRRGGGAQTATGLPPGRRSAGAVLQSLSPIARRAPRRQRRPLSRHRRRRVARRRPARLDRGGCGADPGARGDRAGPAQGEAVQSRRARPVLGPGPGARRSGRPRLGERLGFVGDAGFGLRADHRIGDSRFTTRLDFPLYVSRPEVAHGADPGDENVGFRWTFSFEPAIP